ncbi:MAG: hypothetical protein NC418_06845 [Muribaculaceae bacterium]|nr:hypothetical protein [Muribaculaceae bacterium]
MMKKLMYLILFLLPTSFVGCGGSNSTIEDDSLKNDSIATQQEADSLASLIHTLDSISNSGELVHYDIYQVGKIKGIEVSVQKVSVDTTQIAYINLRKDCGGEYYYSWEDAMIFSKELPSLYSAVSNIQSNLNRAVDHEERFAYVTKDNIAFLASAEPNKSWATRFSVDSHKSNSTITLVNSDIETLVSLIKQAEEKLKEIKNKH